MNGNMNTAEFNRIKGIFQERKNKRNFLLGEIQTAEDKISYVERKISYGEKGRAVIQLVAKDTQKNLEFHFSSLVTTALKSVSEDWPSFGVEMVIRRNQTECDLYFEEFGIRQKPENSSGCGPMDVASFALRIAYWSLKKNRPTFLLDEPFRNVSPDLQHKVSEMMHLISNKKKIQFIMISHAKEINYAADKTFNTSKKGKFSKVEVLK